MERVRLLSDEIIVVIRKGQVFPALPLNLPVKYLTDVYPGTGSLGGMYTGLLDSRNFHSLVVACDMPFLNTELLNYMLGLSPEFDVVIPRLGGHEDPLHAVYSKRCLEPIRQLLMVGRFRIVDFFPQVQVRYLEEDEVNQFDPQHLSFFNINTAEDLDRALEMVR